MFRVVIYAEGAGELAGTVRHPRAPSSPLGAEELGAAHLLVRRCLEQRRSLDLSLSSVLTEVPVETVLGVAIQEFEAWLIADPEALKAVFRQPLRLDRSPERLGRREAKQQLQQWSEQHARSKDTAELRRQLAETCDLDTVSRQCPAFSELLDQLGGRRP